MTSYGRMILRAANQKSEQEDIPLGLALVEVVDEENYKADLVRSNLGLPPMTSDARPVWVQRIHGDH